MKSLAEHAAAAFAIATTIAFAAPFNPVLRTAAVDSAAVVAVVDQYHRALADGDSAAALALLSSDAMILESGAIETRAEYRSGHLAADIQFARAVASTHGPVSVVMHDPVAWAISTSVTRGTFRGRALNSQGAELMVLTREQDRWMIRAIHWSSHARH